MVVGFPVAINETNLDWIIEQARPEIGLDIAGSDRMIVRRTSAKRFVTKLLDLGAKVVYQHHENVFSACRTTA